MRLIAKLVVAIRAEAVDAPQDNDRDRMVREDNADALTRVPGVTADFYINEFLPGADLTFDVQSCAIEDLIERSTDHPPRVVLPEQAVNEGILELRDGPWTTLPV